MLEFALFKLQHLIHGSLLMHLGSTAGAHCSVKYLECFKKKIKPIDVTQQ